MKEKKMILVAGGTGKQGGAVARHLAKAGFRVRAMTRNSSSAKARELENLGIEVVQADLDNTESYRSHMKGVDGVFSVQPIGQGAMIEIKQGKKLADMAETMGVRHFVYSSVAGADAHSGIPHFESKFVIENYIKELDLPYTILRPVSFFENFLHPQVKEGILHGRLVQPVKSTTVLHYISVDDIGKVAAMVFENPEKYLGRTLALASEEMSAAKAAEILSKELGYPVQYSSLHWIAKRFFLGKDLYKMFSWLDAGNLLVSKEELDLNKDLPGFIKFPAWIHNNFKSQANA